jgi:hypothetical protein
MSSQPVVDQVSATEPVTSALSSAPALSTEALPQRADIEVVAVGDNHGCNPQFLKDDLAAHGVLDLNGRFNPAYTGVVLQIGDTVDRGQYSREIYDFWRELQTQAPNQVIRLVGNHELYHIIGFPGIINASEIPGLQVDLIDDIKAGKLIVAWYERDVLYTHAGVDLTLFPEYSGRSLEFIANDLNRRLVEMVNKIDLSDPYHNYPLLETDPVFSSGPYGNGYMGGVFWARQPIENDQFRQVVGHTPQKDGIKADPGMRVKYIDANRARAEHKPGEEGENAREFMMNSIWHDRKSGKQN